MPLQSSIHYRPIHTSSSPKRSGSKRVARSGISYYVEKYGEQSLPITEAVREVTLPLYPTMGDDEIFEVSFLANELIEKLLQWIE